MKGGYFQEVLVNNKDERNNPEMDAEILPICEKAP